MEEILHHQKDVWNPINNGINLLLVQDFFHPLYVPSGSLHTAMETSPCLTIDQIKSVILQPRKKDMAIWNISTQANHRRDLGLGKNGLFCTMDQVD